MFVFALFLLTLVATATAHRRCEFNCTCANDHACQFFCKEGRCQYAIPLNETCSGYETHPRECGKNQWCNSTTKQCEGKKSKSLYCEHDYECRSNHCNEKGFCKKERDEDEEEFSIPMIVPTAASVILFLILIIVIIVYQKRITELQRRPSSVTIIHPNAGVNMEMKAPPYTATPIHQS